jgi:hypothetical protein
MRRYLVGGSVRDRLLGIEGGDRDWVVVGATPQQMLADGFQPVGKDFPVFLHPETKEEHALARTERKTGPGYTGFVVHAEPSVTLEQDLERRDFTVNAIAQDEDGALLDPFGGARDLEARVLRHVSPAFAEDPVRILRGARFLARFAPLGFTVAPAQVVFERHVGSRIHGEALVAAPALALRARQGVLLAAVRVQEHREIRPDRAVAGVEHLLRRGADHDPVGVGVGQPEQAVAHRAADDEALHAAQSTQRPEARRHHAGMHATGAGPRPGKPSFFAQEPTSCDSRPWSTGCRSEGLHR